MSGDFTKFRRADLSMRVRLHCFLTLTLAAFPLLAADPWAYHGIELGAKMTGDQIMHALGADKYAKNPKYDPWNNSRGCDKNPEQSICKEADFYKYGVQAIEYEEFQVGPSCEDKQPGTFSCVNPWMATTIPNWIYRGHGVCKVYVFVRDGLVSSIDIYFDSTSAEEFFGVARRQFGTGWTVKHQSLHISERANPKKGITIDRTIQNKNTKLHSAMMTDYDQIFTHVAGPIYQGILEIKSLDETL